jgi:Transposase DDE domain
LPPQHLVDAGYVDAESLVVSQTAYQIDLVGPTAQDHRWQAREQNGYALTDFSIDWEHEQARCPQGQTSSSWTPTRTRNQEVIKIKFGYATCGACPVRAQCTQSRQRTRQPFGGVRRILHERPRASASEPRSLLSCMPGEQAEMPFMLRESAAWDCAARVILESRAPICNMW